MLPTEDIVETRPCYYTDGISKHTSQHIAGKTTLSIIRSMNGMQIPNSQHLYVTISQDVEPIKKGDWVVQTCSDFIGIKEIARVTKVKYNKKVRTDLCHITTTFDPTESFRSDNDWCRKIIATTDPKLRVKTSRNEKIVNPGVYEKPLPQVSQSFLKEFVVNPDGEWEIEYGESTCKCLSCGSSVKSTCDYAYRCNIQITKKLKLNQDNAVNITLVKEKMHSDEKVKNLLMTALFEPSPYNVDEAMNWIKENL